MFKQNYLFFILSLLFVFCKEQSKQLNTKGSLVNQYTKLENDTTTVIFEDSTILKSKIIRDFYYHDSLFFGHPILLNKLKTKIVLQQPVMLFQALDQSQPFYFIYPGEQITISTNKSNSLIFTVKNNIERTNELNFFRELILKYGGLYDYIPSKYYQKKIQ
ncbi:MAG: hypothetical protein ABI405_01015, partial [Parafilimonas sp.]